ncbi:MAG: DUF3536 domain-containing protein [Saprospiraceae bacterium]|nr:DUF3536 domain-containing protein [Saprospiraceae bacterium]
MNSTNKFICIHGHFYQPPRENAWLEVIEIQDGAAPFHDWNERINFECYAPNAAARIHDQHQQIVKIVNNYTRISFNFGPTLLSWLEQADPETYQAILNADKISLAHFGGHGNALAQVHSHLIMPLANVRDQETQVVWGIRDFEHRFQRKPEGMWLAEAAVNTESLEVLAAHGIKFTILAARQAKAVRRIGEEKWIELPHQAIDTRQPYLCKLPSGRSIAIFFYHPVIAQAVAFEGLLNSGRQFAKRIADALDDSETPQLAHIATDGESYGHHHRYGEMALADCLNFIEEKSIAHLTNYGQYLASFPPKFEAQIHENSSWSCVHGVERWRSDCGCNSGGKPGWNQASRCPLRETLNWVRDELAKIYKKEARKLLKNPWEARNAYIDVLLNRTDERVTDFLTENAVEPLDIEQHIQAMRLLEMQRHAILMFTSCGWFFDEISGLETNQILQYANRAIYYARQVGDTDLHPKFIQLLEGAPSNVHANGAVSYRQTVMPARVDLERVGMHYAASSLFEEYPERLEMLNYSATSEVFERLEAGILKLALGRTTVQSKITYSEKQFSFAALYLGQHNIIGNISVNMNREVFDDMTTKISRAFHTSDLSQVIGIMQEYFGPEKYSISHLFRDEKQKILRDITANSLRQVESDFREIYNDNYQLMSIIAQNDIPVPDAYKSAIQFILYADLRRLFENGNLNIRELKRLVGEFRNWNIPLKPYPDFLLKLGERIFREIRSLDNSPATLSKLQTLIAVLGILEEANVRLDFWRSQNSYFHLLKEFKNSKLIFPDEEWEQAFYRLGGLLKVRSEGA